jgi:hypothetical protein
MRASTCWSSLLEERRIGMHIIIASILIALVVSVLVLVAFWLFTLTSFAHHLGASDGRGRRPNRPAL